MTTLNELLEINTNHTLQIAYNLKQKNTANKFIKTSLKRHMKLRSTGVAEKFNIVYIAEI